jgi:hypothetical protein
MLIQKIATLAAALLLLGATPQSNIRELCRQRVAGHYLSIFDSIERDKQLLILVETHLTDIKAALELENKKFHDLSEKLRQAPFDADLMTRTAQASAMVRQYEAAKADQEMLQSKSRRQLAVEQEVKDTFKHRLEGVFVFEKVNNSAGYDFQLRYKTACPKFRQSCPIEGTERQALIDSFGGDPLPIECQKYTGILRSDGTSPIKE